MIETIFHDFGLTDYETKVYLALIEVGEATTGEILNEANIHSGKIYQILNSLKRKGFVSEVIKNGVRKYFPTKPDEILDFFQDKREKINSQEIAFNKILPELVKKIENSKKDPHIEIFYGWSGLKKAFSKEIERYSGSGCLRINGITNYDRHPKKFVDYFVYNLFPIREKFKIKIKKIVDESAKNNPHEKRARIRSLNYESVITFNTISDLVIVSIWSEQPIFIVVESEDVAKGFRENFELLWKISN
ncbi:MAG: helix-turn-helix domain-containing protein [Nanoarchaeota archaeon]|nr:helix-turn-helix domain-containing protein [Nanoarchaeota archaeon]